MLKADPAVLRRISQILEDELYPDGTEILEPHASPPRKGRPTITKPSGEAKALLNSTYRPPGVADRDLHHSGDLVIDLVPDQRNHQLELTLFSTYLVPVFPLCYSN